MLSGPFASEGDSPETQTYAKKAPGRHGLGIIPGAPTGISGFYQLYRYKRAQRSRIVKLAVDIFSNPVLMVFTSWN